MKPLVSIVIPVFNTGAEASILIRKILHDKYENLEIIAVDDGSNDDSLQKIKTIRDKRLKVLHKENGGASSARNLGIARSSGDYLLFIDSDDDIDPDFISDLVAEIRKKNTALVATAVHYRKLAISSDEDVYLNEFLRGKNESQKEFVLRSLLCDGRMYPAFNKIFKAKIIRDNDILFDENLDFAEDTKFVLDYLESCSGEIHFITKPLYIYNFGTATSTVSHSGIIWKNWLKSFENVKKWVGKNPSLRERALLFLIISKWRVSCFRAARRARK